MSQLEDLLDLYPEMTQGGCIKEWLNNPMNIVISYGDNFGLFTFIRPGVYEGHYLFTTRGKAMISIAKNILDEIFNYAKLIQGITPKKKRHILILNRRLGFQSYGDIDAPLDGPSELFILTKDRHNEFNLRGN